MVESAAIRDISEASVYPGALLHPFFLFCGLDRMQRIFYSQAVYQNRILRVVRHPLTRCVEIHRDPVWFS